MAAKKSFVLRIDENLYRSLEKWAGDEFRSVNGQIEWLIHQELKKAGRIRPLKEEENARSGKGKNEGQA